LKKGRNRESESEFENLSLDDLIAQSGGFKNLFEKFRSEGVNLENQIERIFSGESPLFSIANFSVEKVGSGYAELSFPFGDKIARRGSMVHGGVVSYALDTAGGLAVMSENAGVDQVTLELKINFLEPVKNSPFKVTGKVLRQGRNVAVAESEVKDSGGKLCAKSLGTWYLIYKR
jgi:acyl-CoA thioesterase